MELDDVIIIIVMLLIKLLHYHQLYVSRRKICMSFFTHLLVESTDFHGNSPRSDFSSRTRLKSMNLRKT